MASFPFPSFPVSGIIFPSVPLIISALEYTKQHTSPATLNHSLRSGAFALIISKKIPALSTINAETVILSTLMHDLGWAITKEILSKDKRFEVDGANLAKAFISSQSTSSDFSQERLNLIWNAIALHTTPSISLEHPDANIPAVRYGIVADFVGPNMPNGLISIDEYKEVVSIFCNLCRDKPETTFDNFVSQFGVKFFEGEEGDKFKQALKEAEVVDKLLGGLEACREWE
jgi:hypothetical protein